MSSAHDGGKEQWKRVAAELRAYRDLQQQAWGDLDNATLGRYLAGEVDTEERRQVESALNELPELRRLTDLVRDVLSDFEPAVDQVPEAPVLLPFSQRPARPSLYARLRRRSALVAAACLLLALGLGMPRLRQDEGGSPAAPTESRVRLRGADRLVPPSQTTLVFKTSGDAPTKPSDGRVSLVVASRLDHLDRSLSSLEKQGKLEDALVLAQRYPAVAREARLESDPRYARSLEQVGRLYEKKGDLVHAEHTFRKAHAICAKSLGTTHPETVQNVKLLANVYQVALNAPVALASPAYPINPYLPSATAHGRDMRPGSAAPTPATGTYVPSDPFQLRMTFLASRIRKAATLGAEARPEPGHRLVRPLATDELVSDIPDVNFGYQTAVPGVNPVMVNGIALMARAAQTWSASTGEGAKKLALPPARPEAVAFQTYLIRQRPTELKQTVVPVLVEAWKVSSTPQERIRLAQALGRLGPAARPAVPVLTARLQTTSDKAEQQAILRALGQMGPAARPALPVLLSSLRSTCPEARRSAAEALVHLGPAARDTVLAYKGKTGRAPNALARDVFRRIQGREGRIGVKDECECFSVLALRQNTQAIQQLARTANVELLVETVPDLTAECCAAAKDCVQRSGAKGVHLVIAVHGPAVRVTLSESLRKQGFSARKLEQVVEEHLRRKDYDGGLTESIGLLARFEAAQNTRKKLR